MSEAQHPAVIAPLALENHLRLIESLCQTGVPKSAVGDHLALMRKMPEWDILRKALPATDGPAQDKESYLARFGESTTAFSARAVAEDTWEAATAAASRSTEKLNMDVIRQAYGWTIDVHGEVCGLIAGDMGYESTGIKLDGETLRMWKAACRQPQPVQIGHIPPGWTIERADRTPFKYISIKAPNGARAQVSNVDRNPSNLLYMLTDALLTIQPPDLAAPPTNEDRCTRCGGGRDLPNRKCPAGKSDCTVYPGWDALPATELDKGAA